MSTGTATLASIAEQRRAAIAHRAAGRYGDAESPLLAAIEPATTVFGDDDATAAVLRNDLAVTYKYAGRCTEAETLYWLALPVLLAALGADHVVVAAVWHNLGGIRHAQGDLDAAEQFARRGLTITSPPSATITSPSPPTGQHWRDPRDRGDDDEAEALLHQALAVFTSRLGADHYEVAVALHNRAAIIYRRGDLDAAEALARRSLELRAAALGVDHPELASTLNNLAAIHIAQRRYADADAAYRRALTVLANSVDESHPALAAIRTGLAALARTSRPLARR